MLKVGDPTKARPIKTGKPVEDRIYNRKDFDRNLVIEERTELVAKKLTEFLKGYDRFAKTLCFVWTLTTLNVCEQHWPNKMLIWLPRITNT
jgi:hypothetical protein